MRWPYLFVLCACACYCGFSQSYTISTFAGGPPHPASQATRAAIGNPAGVAIDRAGNVYFFSRFCIFKVDPTGQLTRIAGNYIAGYSGDGGPATSAQIHGPLLTGYYSNTSQDFGLAVDNAGNVCIPDPVANRVRKVSPSGIITTVAGNGTGNVPTSQVGDGGPATAAAVTAPNHLAVDSTGNLFVAESLRIRKVTPDGVIHTVAGPFLAPLGITADSAGNLFIAETNVVQKLTPDGAITTVAGKSQSPGYTGDSGPATSAQLQGASDIAVDAAGNLYISDNVGYYIRKVSPNGIITTIAGNGVWGFAGDGVPALSSPVAPEGLAADSAGNLYVADFDAGRIRRISAAGTVDTVAGNGGQWFEGDGGQAVNAVFSSPGQVAVDKAGNVYIADRANNRIRKVAPDGTITTVAGNGSGVSSGDGGPAVNAGVVYPSGVTVDGAGNLYVEDQVAGIRRISPAGIITTVLGSSPAASPQPPASQPVLAANLFVADSKSNLYFIGRGIQRLAPDGTQTFLGELNYYFGGLAMNAADTLFYADTLDDVIGTRSSDGIFGGVNTTTGCQTGYGFNFQPYGLAVDHAGNLYVADPDSSTIRRIAPSGVMETIAGNFTAGDSGDGGPATAAQVAQPASIAVDGAGNIYVSDPIDNVVRVLRPSAPAPVSVAAVTNGASNLAGPVAPGEIVVLYGAGLGPTPLVTCRSGAAGLVDTALNDTQVFFNSSPARVIYTSASQVAAVVPYGIFLGTVQVSVAFQDGKSAMTQVTVNTSAPGIFTMDGSGKGQADAANQDGSVNSAAKPARPGEYISLYATGEGQTSPAGVDGQLAANPLPHPVLPVTVTIGGQTVQPQYAGGAPGYPAGLIQINVQIPAGTTAGSVPVTIQVGFATSQSGVTIEVGPALRPAQ